MALPAPVPALPKPVRSRPAEMGGTQTPPMAEADLFPQPPEKLTTPPELPFKINDDDENSSESVPAASGSSATEDKSKIRPLKMSELKKLPTKMSYQDRVHGLLSGKSPTSASTNDKEKVKIKVKVEEIDKKKKTVDPADEPYEPPGMSDVSDEELPQSSKNNVQASMNEFNIDPTRSFLDPPPKASTSKSGGLKLKSIDQLTKPANEDSQPPSKITSEAKQPTKTKSAIGALIHALKKNPAPGPSGGSAPPPPPTSAGSSEAAPPPPPEAGGVSPPKAESKPPAATPAMDQKSMDEILLGILSELDQDMTEAERLQKAKMKLAQMFAKAQGKAKPGPRRMMGPRSRMPGPPGPGGQPRMGPRSRMPGPPGYRPGPRSRALNPNMLTARPPPPPPEEPSKEDISSFMNQYGVDGPPPQVSQPPPNSGGPAGGTVPQYDGTMITPPSERGSSSGGGEPAYSSALAKLRAKKAARNAQQGGNLLSMHPPPFGGPSHIPSLMDMKTAPPASNISERIDREAEFNSRFLRRWDDIMHRNWQHCMDKMYDELWVSFIFIQNSVANFDPKK